MVRPPQMRADEAERMRRKARHRKIVFGFFIFLGLIIVLESPLTRVRQFMVTGNLTIPAGQILQDTTLHKGMSLWEVSSALVTKQIIAKEPMVQSVDVHTDFLRGTVSLTIHEKHVVAIYASQGKFYNLLNDGVLYGSTSSSAGFAFPLVTVSETVHLQQGALLNPDVRTLCRQLSQLDSGQLADVSEIHVSQNGVLTIYLTNGFVAKCDVGALKAAMPNIDEAVTYFASKGYVPGLIDFTGPPPYRYTPLSTQVQNVQKGGVSQNANQG